MPDNCTAQDCEHATRILTDLIAELRNLEASDSPFDPDVVWFRDVVEAADRAEARMRGVGEPPDSSNDRIKDDVPMVVVGAGELDHISVDEAEFAQWKIDHRCSGDDKSLRLIYQLQKQAGRL